MVAGPPVGKQQPEDKMTSHRQRRQTEDCVVTFLLPQVTPQWGPKLENKQKFPEKYKTTNISLKKKKHKN